MEAKVYTDAQGVWIERDGLREKPNLKEANRRIKELADELALMLTYLKELGKRNVSRP